MDVLEKKYNSDYDYSLINNIKYLKYYNNTIDIKGSSALKSQQFYSDIDLFTSINRNDSYNRLYNGIYIILDYIGNNDDMYFIEYKAQLKDEKKIRLHYKDSFNSNDFKKYYEKIDFIKIDLVLVIHNIFTEISVIYKLQNFKNEEVNEIEFIKSIKEDITDELKQHNYFKVLKRYFILYRTEKLLDNDKLKKLSMIFNSKLGEIYQRVSNLRALQIVYKYYKDNLTLNKININLKDIDEPVTIIDIQTKIDEYENILNTESIKLYKDIIKPSIDYAKVLQSRIDKKLQES